MNDSIFSKRHTTLPAKLVRFQLKDGTQTAVLCAPLSDLNERILSYVTEWAAKFPDNKIVFVCTENLVRF